MKTGMIWIDSGRCLACGTCELQCSIAHSQSQDLFAALQEVPLSQPRLTVEAADGIAVPMQCRHCTDAPCVQICPTGALEHSGAMAPVLLTHARCIGCRFCIQVCPFGVIRMNQAGTILIKCDLCIDRLRRNEMPACVSGCPTEALRFLSVDEYVVQLRQQSVQRYMMDDRNGHGIG